MDFEKILVYVFTKFKRIVFGDTNICKPTVLERKPLRTLLQYYLIKTAAEADTTNGNLLFYIIDFGKRSPSIPRSNREYFAASTYEMENKHISTLCCDLFEDV